MCVELSRFRGRPQTLEVEGEESGAHGNEDGRLLNADEVAERLGLPKGRVYELGRRGEAGAVRIGERSIRFSAAGLEAWVREGGS